MTAPTDAEMKAALMAQIAAYKERHGIPTWNAQLEERMAHVANGGTLRAVPAGRAMRVRFRRGAPDDQGFVSDDGVHINRWEPDAGDVA